MPADSSSAELEQSGLAELMEDLQSSVEGMTAAAEKLAPTMEEFAGVPAKVGDLPDEPTPKQANAWSFRLAHEFKAPAEGLEANGRQLFEATRLLDETLLKLKQLTESIADVPELGDSLTQGRRTLIAEFGDLHDVASTLEELLRSMRPAEVFSVPVRKALQPARPGLTAVKDSLGLIESWQGELAEPGPASTR